jgi:hypothetical protein
LGWVVTYAYYWTFCKQNWIVCNLAIFNQDFVLPVHLHWEVETYFIYFNYFLFLYYMNLNPIY